SGANRFPERGPEFPHLALAPRSRASSAREEILALSRLATPVCKALRHHGADLEKPESTEVPMQEPVRAFALVGVFRNPYWRRQAGRSFCSQPHHVRAGRAPARSFQ